MRPASALPGRTLKSWGEEKAVLLSLIRYSCYGKGSRFGVETSDPSWWKKLSWALTERRRGSETSEVPNRGRGAYPNVPYKYDRGTRNLRVFCGLHCECNSTHLFENVRCKRKPLTPHLPQGGAESMKLKYISLFIYS